MIFFFISKIQDDFIEAVEDNADEESEFIIPEVAQERCICNLDAQEHVVILDEPNVRNNAKLTNAIATETFPMNAIIIENNLLQDFANELAKEVLGDILITNLPNNYEIDHHDRSVDFQDKHDSFKDDSSKSISATGSDQGSYAAKIKSKDDSIIFDQAVTEQQDDINNHSITNFNEESDINDNDTHLIDDEDELFLVLQPPQQVSMIFTECKIFI